MLGEYKKVLQDAWDFTKKNRFMWWFGFFAAFLGGNGGEYEMLIRNLFDLEAGRGLFLFLTPGAVKAQFVTWQTLFFDVEPIGWFVALVIAIIGLFFLWLIFVSQGGLIHAVGRRIPKRGMTFDKIFRAGREFAPKVFTLNLISKAVVAVIFVALALPFSILLENNQTTGWLAATTLIAFFVLVPVAIVVSFLLKYALCFLVLKGQGISQSIVSAWKLFVKNWMVTAELALLIFAINVLVGLTMTLVLVIVALPMYFLFAFFLAAGWDIAFWLLFMVVSIVFFVAIFTFGAVFSTFQWAAWTRLFTELTKTRLISIVTRWIRALFPRTTERLEEIAEGDIEVEAKA